MAVEVADKTVFISYRRSVSRYIARSIFEDLTQNGYDVFMDVESIDSGAFDTIILNQISARAHFVVILTDGSVERCTDPDDWLRREIEHAMALKRNIIPVLVEDFSLSSVAQYMTGKLSQLSRYNAIRLYNEYFAEAMDRLRSRYLKQPVRAAITPAPLADVAEIQRKLEKVAQVPMSSHFELTAEVYFARAYKKQERGNLDGAIEDYTKAINQHNDYQDAYLHRGSAYVALGKLPEALADFDEAIRLDADDYKAYDSRGQTHFALGDYDHAFADFQKENTLRPAEPSALAGLAITNHVQGGVEEAKRLWNVIIVLDATYKTADGVKQRLRWSDALAQEAQKVITAL